MSRSLVEASGEFGCVSQISAPVGPRTHPLCHALFTLAGDNSLFDVDGRLCPMTTETAVLVGAW